MLNRFLVEISSVEKKLMARHRVFLAISICAEVLKYLVESLVLLKESWSPAWTFLRILSKRPTSMTMNLLKRHGKNMSLNIHVDTLESLFEWINGGSFFNPKLPTVTFELPHNPVAWSKLLTNLPFWSTNKALLILPVSKGNLGHLTNTRFGVDTKICSYNHSVRNHPRTSFPIIMTSYLQRTGPITRPKCT